MGELISKLGIDWKLLLAQIINFLVLLWILKRFAYKPLLNMLDKRRATIEKSLDDAKKIEDQLKRIEQEKESMLGNARNEARMLVESATKDAAAFIAKSKEEAKIETAAMVATAKKEVERMKDSVVAEARDEIASLVIASTEKVIRIKLNPTTEKELISDALTRAKEKV